MFFSFYAIPNLLCFFACLGIGFFVFAKRSRTPVGVSFLLLALSAATWQIGTFFVLSSASAELALLFCRLTYLGSLFIPITTYHFVLAGLGQIDSSRKSLILAYGIGICFFLPVSQTTWFISSVYSYPWGYWWRSNNLHMVFLAFLLLLMTVSFYKLWKGIRTSSSGLEKIRRKYLFLGLLIAYLGAVDYAPNYGFGVYPFGYLPIFIYILMTSYAIVRYKLLDIEVIIKKTIVFAGIVAAAVGAIAFPFALIQAVIGQALGAPHPLLFIALGIATTVLIYRPVERFLVNVTDKFLFQKKYNYHRLLRENSKQLSLIKSLDEMAKQIVAFLIKQGRIRNAGIFIQSHDQKRFELKYPLGYGGRTKRPSLSLDPAHPLLKLVVERKTPLVLEEIEKGAKGTASVSGTNVEEVLSVMKKLNAEVVIPSFLGTPINNQGKDNNEGYQLRNLLVLGPKKSDEEYTDEDLDVFFTIAQDSAIAAENARLFDLILKERESRLKAESEAKLVAYAKSLGHEVKNKLSGLYGPSQGLVGAHTGNMVKFFERHLKGKINQVAEKIYFDFVEKIKQEGQTVLAKADEIWTIVKTAEGTLTEDRDAFQPVHVRIVWDAAKDSIPKTKCKIKLDVPERFFPFGNAVLLRDVFTNLLTNAVEALEGREDGTIVLHGEYRYREGNPGTYFQFKDNGCGISPEVVDRIFDQGFSTKPKPKSMDMKASGHGQGLWVCKQTIENVHSGKMWVESKVGNGTTFHIWLPLGPDQQLPDELKEAS